MKTPNEKKDLDPKRYPWDWIEVAPKKALRLAGISIEEQEKEEYWCHVVAEDPRYPMFVVNGEEVFGMRINPETGFMEGPRFCICGARSEFSCFCSI